MDVQLTVKGYLELARTYCREAEEMREAAFKIGGDWFTEYYDRRAKALRCCDHAVEMLGDFDMLPSDLIAFYIPF